MSIKYIPEELLKMPKTLPNDIENFCYYYPMKYPNIVAEFEKQTLLLAEDPAAYRAYGDRQHIEMEAMLNKIMKEHYALPEEKRYMLENLVKTEQKLSKMFCFKFWIVNYLFADGPIHDFYVTKIREFARKLVDPQEDTVEYEADIKGIEHDLLQTDYADIYLKNALSSLKLIKILQKDAAYNQISEKIQFLLKQGVPKEELHKEYEKLISLIEKQKDTDALNILSDRMNQVKMRKSKLPLYTFITQVFEFYEENILLKNRYDNLKTRIENILDTAKQKLSGEEYALFALSYEQAKNFSMYKDVMGRLDHVLLPFWFDEINGNIYKILINHHPSLSSYPCIGQAALFIIFVWFLPPKLKNYVMTPDLTPLKD